MSAAAGVAGSAVAHIPGSRMNHSSQVNLTVNGETHVLDVDNRTTLLDALRENLHLNGTKKAVTMASAAPAR